MVDAHGSLSERVLRLPLFLLLIGVFSALMLLPAAYAGLLREHEAGRAFLYSGLLGLIVFSLVALAHRGRAPRHGTLGPLVSLFSAFVLLPFLLAVPFYEALKTTTFLNAYVEMVSAITTTGAPVFSDPDRLSPVLHLWRALVAWTGGLVMWIAAAAILAPLNLGGFEVTARAEPGRRERRAKASPGEEVRQRIRRSTAALAPVYVGLSILLTILLMVLGDRAFIAACHAMSIMATSGISPVGGLEDSASGWPGEIVILLFMAFSLSRLTFSADTVTSAAGGLTQDPEVRIGLAILLTVPLFLFLRHWLGAYDVMAEESFRDAMLALWGSAFTVMSFLSTNGFTSESWGAAQTWSGLQTPGLVLMGLALIGGGVATTAGGVKLLRVFALYANGRRELERLVHPSSVSGAGTMERRLQKDGAFIAWIFFMLFAVTLAVITIALAAYGMSFEQAIVIAIAGLSTTGPLLNHGVENAIELGNLGAGPKVIFAAAMVIGRLETLAIIALLTPDLWRA